MNLGALNSIWRKQTDQVPASASLAVAEPAPLSKAAASDLRRFIARQTIFDHSRNVYGYELLFRSGWDNFFSGDNDEATRIMIADGALYGFHDLTHDAPTFVNCTRESLVNGLVTLLPTSTVLEILETVTGDTEVLEACTRYKRLGYKIALDDFQMHDGMRGLIELADYIKVDFRLSDAEERRSILAALKHTQVTLLAEKVETEQEFQAALNEGFTLFQGYFFCRPTVFSKTRMPTNGINYLYLLSALSQDEFHVAQIALLLKSEVALSYQLLRLVNSAGFGMRREVSSLEDALMLVGELQFRTLLLNAIATETCRTRSSELLVHVLHRARFLELLAPFTGEDAMEQYLFGLLSLMHVMLDIPQADLLEALPLRKEVKQALGGQASNINRALTLFEAYQDADWTSCTEQAVFMQMTEGKLSEIYKDALFWAERSIKHDQAESSKLN